MRPSRLFRGAAFTCASVFIASSASGQTTEYIGTWNNATFGSSGPARLTTTLTGSTFTANFDLDNGPGGIVFGQPVDPGPLLISGTIGSGGTLSSVSATPNPHAVYGPMTIAAPDIANMTINMTDIPAAGLTTGQIIGGRQSGGTFLFNYTVNFASGGGAAGTVTMRVVPEPSSSLLLLSFLARRRRR